MDFDVQSLDEEDLDLDDLTAFLDELDRKVPDSEAPVHDDIREQEDLLQRVRDAPESARKAFASVAAVFAAIQDRKLGVMHRFARRWRIKSRVNKIVRVTNLLRTALSRQPSVADVAAVEDDLEDDLAQVDDNMLDDIDKYIEAIETGQRGAALADDKKDAVARRWRKSIDTLRKSKQAAISRQPSLETLVKEETETCEVPAVAPSPSRERIRNVLHAWIDDSLVASERALAREKKPKAKKMVKRVVKKRKKKKKKQAVTNNDHVYTYDDIATLRSVVFELDAMMASPRFGVAVAALRRLWQVLRMPASETAQFEAAFCRSPTEANRQAVVRELGAMLRFKHRTVNLLLAAQTMQDAQDDLDAAVACQREPEATYLAGKHKTLSDNFSRLLAGWQSTFTWHASFTYHPAGMS